MVEEAAEMDDSQKQEMMGVLMREHTSLAMKLNRDQTRQEEKVCGITIVFVTFLMKCSLNRLVEFFIVKSTFK